MAGALKIKPGTKLHVAYDAPIGKEPDFSMISSFGKSLDDSTFLISVPMSNGRTMIMDENQKLLIKTMVSSNNTIVAGYVDAVVKQGVRTYWKIRRVAEQRQFFQRADERLKVALNVSFTNATWQLKEDGSVNYDTGMTLDISNGGAAIYMNDIFDVGDVIELNMPRIGVAEEGQPVKNIVSAVCWMREAPKGSIYKRICGVQFRFADDTERDALRTYTAYVKKRYKL